MLVICFWCLNCNKVINNCNRLPTVALFLRESASAVVAIVTSSGESEGAPSERAPIIDLQSLLGYFCDFLKPCIVNTVKTRKYYTCMQIYAKKVIVPTSRHLFRGCSSLSCFPNDIQSFFFFEWHHSKKILFFIHRTITNSYWLFF